MTACKHRVASAANTGIASRFVCERGAVMEELLALLAERGIEPEATEGMPPGRFTEHRR